jgi:hypothetical protein
LVSEPAHSV